MYSYSVIYSRSQSSPLPRLIHYLCRSFIFSIISPTSPLKISTVSSNFTSLSFTANICILHFLRIVPIQSSWSLPRYLFHYPSSSPPHASSSSSNSPQVFSILISLFFLSSFLLHLLIFPQLSPSSSLIHSQLSPSSSSILSQLFSFSYPHLLILPQLFPS